MAVPVNFARRLRRLPRKAGPRQGNNYFGSGGGSLLPLVQSREARPICFVNLAGFVDKIASNDPASSPFVMGIKAARPKEGMILEETK